MQETTENVLRVPFRQQTQIYEAYLSGTCLNSLSILTNTEPFVIRHMIMHYGRKLGRYTPVPRT